jgi:hypothetical protein
VSVCAYIALFLVIINLFLSHLGDMSFNLMCMHGQKLLSLVCLSVEGIPYGDVQDTTTKLVQT